MGFYSNHTPELRRVTELTGDIHLSEEFKEETKRRGIPLFKAYNIQKRLRFEAEEEKIKGNQVDKRLKELLDENTKKEETENVLDENTSENKNLLLKVIEQNETLIKQNDIIIKELKKFNER